MLNYISNLKKKLDFIIKVIKLEDFSIHSISKNDQLKGLISGTIHSYFQARNIQGVSELHQLVDQIFAKISSTESFKDSFDKNINDYYMHKYWEFTLVAGYASLWEMRVKILAEHLGIEVKRQTDKLGKRPKRAKILPFRDLAEIITEVNKKITRNIDLELTQISKLRSALIHGNFNQLRVFANNCNHNYPKNHKGNVFVMNIKTKETINLSENLSLEQRVEQSIFSWFMDIGNSDLLNEVWKILDQSILKMNLILDLKGYCPPNEDFTFSDIIQGKIKICKNIKQGYSDSIKDISKYKNSEEFFLLIKENFGQKIFE